MSELRAACFGSDEWPTVSVVMPVRNEAEHLERAVASILEQDYPLPFDVCLAVAPSDDATAEVADRIATSDDRVSVVNNPAGMTPIGLNAAIAATSGAVVVRVDGHAELSPGYVRHAVETMRKTGAVNVGGLQVPDPTTPFESAVAAATTSWMGTGGAAYRIGGVEGPTDTVYLGVFDRKAGDLAGWFDERLIRNQDYELNIRLRGLGGVVWFTPELEVRYRPRGSFVALARQYFEYGWWKARVARMHPTSIRARQLAPAAATAALTISLLSSVRRPRWLVIPAAYAAAVTVTGVRVSKSALTAPALACIHLAWGLGFLTSATRSSRAVARGGHSERRSASSGSIGSVRTPSERISS